MMAPKPPTLPDGDIDRFICRRVCARCYGDLVKRFAEDRAYEAVCPVCEGVWGYTTVSRKHAEGLGQKAIADYWRVRANLPDLFPNPVRGKSSAQILNSLGF